MRGAVVCDEGETRIASDEQWRALECAARSRDTPQPFPALDFVEVFDARRAPIGWTTGQFDDSAWSGVRRQIAGENDPEDLMTGGYICAAPTLQPSEIGALAEHDEAVEALAAFCEVRGADDAPAWERPYQEQPVHGARVSLSGGTGAPSLDAPLEVATPDRAGVSLTFKFSQEWTGYPFIDVIAKGGEEFDFVVAEAFPGEFDGADIRDARFVAATGHMAVNHTARFIARPGRQRFEWFRRTAGRWMQISVRNAPQGVSFVGVGMNVTHYPARRDGAFTCSDQGLNKVWSSAAHTLLMCMQDAWEDCPGREQRQWLGDACVENAVAQVVFGASVEALNEKFIRQVAEAQRADGLTDPVAPGDMGELGFFIPEWTLHWIINAGDHVEYFGDATGIADVFPAIQKALAWFKRHVGPHGLLCRLPYWSFTDWSAYARWGDAGVASGLYIGALEAAAQIASSLDWARAADNYRSEAEALRRAFRSLLWDSERGVFVDVADPDTGLRGRRVSQHVNALAILFGVAAPEHWDSIMDWIADPGRLKITRSLPISLHGESFNEETDCVLANTFFSHFVYKAMGRAGRTAQVIELIRARFGRMLQRGATTLWEGYEPNASLCHGFSTTPAYQLSNQILGVRATAPGYSRFEFAPNLHDLDHAEGAIPTIHGPIQVSLVRRGQSVDIALEIPPGVVGEPSPKLRFIGAPKIIAPGVHKFRMGGSEGSSKA